MKTLVAKTISVGLMLSTLVACSFNGDSTADQAKQYLNDRTKILSAYQPVVGTYDGEISAYVRSQTDVDKLELKKIKLELSVYIQDAQSGRDANGQSTPLPTLVVRYRQLDMVRPDEMMDARFVPESGQLYATNQQSSNNGSNSNNAGSPSNGFVSICSTGGSVTTTLSNTHFDGSTITGTILRGNGQLGTFSVTRTSNQTISPLNDPVTDCNDRLAVEYQAIAGIYKGTLEQTPEAGGGTVDVAMTVTPIQMTTPTGTSATALVSTFRYMTVTVNAMAAVYRPDVTPAQLSMSYLTGGITGGGFSMTGSLDGDTFTGEAYSGNIGHLGHVVVKKVTQPRN